MSKRWTREEALDIFRRAIEDGMTIVIDGVLYRGRDGEIQVRLQELDTLERFCGWAWLITEETVEELFDRVDHIKINTLEYIMRTRR